MGKRASQVFTPEAAARFANLELVAFLGAGEVIDYTQHDFTQTGQTYDIIFDAVGKSSFSQCAASLSPRGVYLTTVPTPEIFLQIVRTSLLPGKKARIAFTALRSARARAKDLVVLKDLVEAGINRIEHLGVALLHTDTVVLLGEGVTHDLQLSLVGFTLQREICRNWGIGDHSVDPADYQILKGEADLIVGLETHAFNFLNLEGSRGADLCRNSHPFHIGKL